MKNIIIFMLFIFLFSIPNSMAIMLTTFGGKSTPSLTVPNYNATCGQFLDGSDANSCSNTSAWRSYTTDSTVNVDVGKYSINFTVNACCGGGGGENSGRFYTGGLYKLIPKGYCVDFKVAQIGQAIGAGTSFGVVWSPSVTTPIGETATKLWFTGAGDACADGAGGFWRLVSTGICGGASKTTSNTSIPINTYQNVTFCQNITTINGAVYFNNSNPSSFTQGDNLATNTANLTFVLSTGASSNANDKISIKDIFVYPQSGAPQGGPLGDTIPPNITFYNMTSEGGAGCTNWNTDKTNACLTSDTTPTVYLITNENAYCAIGISNLNYTDLGGSRDCAGGGTNSLTCTLTLQDEFTYENSNVYIGCKDLNGNQNSTSTSGALRLNITNLDTYIGNSIELGVKNSLSNGYSIYTNQRVYARNSANTQSVGAFDKVAKRLNKIWAFNWISATESYINMFNITPIFYTWEFANKTNGTITNQVELLINATK